ncbi:hypothetical protein FGKAn22_12660 [Ferrigenium kumadai]|uniref:FecR protein domain-containing protein n=1 Tax=Ferrigenium kumadai TaxID=1682490 RepID=A0AAN1VZL7_9PROT|nr:FecR domain-containing protein [Ferrigenium kumadai]BBI99573.1 hypothetical protein FGKAn22_12660 [Ferrigenium kumadai]
MSRYSLLLLVTLLSLASPSQGQAEEVAGKVGYMSGTLVAQRTDGTIKVLGPKSEVLAGDMLITAKDSYAQVLMNDGAKMTLRPHSNLKIESYQFRKEEPKADNAVFRLLKGGFRTITGLIGKRGDPDAYKLRAASATIGIRGTDFTSRLCATQGCQDENGASAKQIVKPPIVQSPVIGRVMLIQGALIAKEESGKSRKLTLGAPVYEGDVLTTGKQSHAVVAFRDEGRVSLQENTVFHVEKFKYDKAASQESAVLRLIKGGVRVVSGWIGRVNHDNYQLKVSSATIGIRGTKYGAWCYGPCVTGALEGVGVEVTEGEVVLVAPGGSMAVAAGMAAAIAIDTGKPVPIVKVPAGALDNKVPLPESVPVDMKEQFGAEAGTGEPGLYVTVHDGHVILVQGDNKIDLGRGETGFTNEQVLSRLTATPVFMGNDNAQINSESSNNSPNPTVNQTGCVVK